MKTGILCLTLILIATIKNNAQYSDNLWGVYYGGSSSEYVEEIAVDPFGNAIITGRTSSKSGIVTAGAYQTNYGGGTSDAFVAKFDSTGSLLWSSYFGGSKTEFTY